MNMNILICGIGGQGTLLAAKILGNAAAIMNMDVKLSEVHGMSQRGGSVVTYVKLSDNAVQSPILSDGGADYILAFEMLEGYRNVSALKPGGVMLANEQQIKPMPVITGAWEYPTEIPEKIRALGVNLHTLDALELAKQAGNTRTVNVVLLGKLSAAMNLPIEVCEEALRMSVKPAFLEVNLKAFHLGRNA